MPMAPGLNRRLKNIEEGSKGGLNSDSLLLDNMTESQLGKGTVGSIWFMSMTELKLN
jgi:hypothetical protein